MRGEGIKVVIGVDRLWRGFGISRVVETQARQLTKMGVDVEVLTGSCRIAPTFKVSECGYSNRLHRMNIRTCITQMRSKKPDVFHSHFYPAEICGALCSHEMPHLMHCYGTRFRSGHPIIATMANSARIVIGERIGFSMCREAIAISDFVKGTMDRAWFSRRPERVSKIRLGIEIPDLPQSAKNRALAKLSDIWRVPVLLSIGALSATKGQESLLGAAKILKDRGLEFRLLLVGRVGAEDPYFGERLRTLAHNLNIESSITFVGELDDSELFDLLMGADVYVTGTKWEGFGLPIIEAFSMATPVVCFGNTALTELVDDGRTGLLARNGDTVDLADRIEELLVDENLRRTMGREARRQAEDMYDITKTCEQLVNVYERLSTTTT